MRASNPFALIGLFLFLTSPLYAQPATLTGTIIDADDGQPLAGANVILTLPTQAGIIGGGATDALGRYSVTGIEAGSYMVTIRFVGYNEGSYLVNLIAGETAILNATLSQGGFDLNTIVISASRQDEKVLDSPASISVLDYREIQQDVVTSTISTLRNTTGVDFSQTGVDRSEVVLRGFNNAFSTSAYIMTDYRHAAVPSLAVNVHSVMPSIFVDVDRIEVVRGPGSALYGAGVDEGVIHYLTKDPFSFPGTTISLTGGERSLFGAQFRHAGIAGSNFGYKITGNYGQAQDWELDPGDALDQVQLNSDAVSRNYDYNKLNLNGMLQYRLGESITITANGGYAELKAIVLSGIGTLQADGFGYTYGQLRFQADRFFAQAYVNSNDAGNSFVYGTGVPVVDKGLVYSAQAQYDLDLANERIRLVVGGDLELTRPNTEGTILGRNEELDDINEMGGYAQSTFELNQQLDLTLALRGDWSNIFDAFQLSPRAAMVYRASQQHTLRASYNQSFSAPGVNSLFLDIVGQSTALRGGDNPLFLELYGRGSAQGATFSGFRQNNTAAMFLPVDGFFGQEFSLSGMPLIPLVGVATDQGLVDFIRNAANFPVEGVTQAQRNIMADLLGYTATTGSLGPTATTDATELGIPDNSAQGFRPIEGPVDIEPLKQTTTRTIEVGYKGLVSDRLLISLDLYFANKKNFTGPLLLETPFVYLQGDALADDVRTALQNMFTNTQDVTIQQLVTGLQNAGLPAAQAAAILGNLIGGSLEGSSVAIVQSDQQILAPGTSNAVGGFSAYRNFGNLDYWGLDASLQVLASEQLTLFANISMVSDDFFDNEELQETNTDLSLALNAPTAKFKFGSRYEFFSGLGLNLSGRFIKGFPVLSGSYIGEIEDYFLLDAGISYDFSRSINGLRFDFSVQNILNDLHREFIGAPRIGRMAMGRLTYTF